jgi:hypothetical protein
VVIARVGGIDAIQAADVSGASPVGCLHVAACLVFADVLDRSALNDAEARWSVKPHMEPEVLAQCHGGATA